MIQTVSNGISNTAYEYIDNDYIITKINVDIKNMYIFEKVDNDTIKLINSNDYPF